MRRVIIVAVLAAQLLTAMPNIAAAKVTPIATGELPTEKDERGLWMRADEDERLVKASNFVIRDEALNQYVRGVFCRTVGASECANVRIYVVRTAYFNASMSPNGMMVMWSGLFLRVRDEAQLAAVLSHEFTHYKNRHTTQIFRDLKSKANTAAIFGIFGLVGSLAQLAILSTIFTFSRSMESEADAGSIPLMVNAGYDPLAAAKIWEQIRAEADATALARGTKSRKDRNGGMFATHPGSAERVVVLTTLAGRAKSDGAVKLNRDEYRRAIAPFWTDFVDDQIKLNDFGATEFLLADLAKDGWTPDLLYARGELYRTRGKPDDLKAASEFYRQSTLGAGPVEAWRGMGLSLLRSGAQAEGQAALKHYLAAKPDASDRAMIAMLSGESK